MHGSPPTMLMAREIEKFPSEQEMVVSRLTVELMRPVGRTPLSVRSRPVRVGRKVQLVEASLWNDEVEVARATAVRMRLAEVAVPPSIDSLPRPEPESVPGWPARSWRSGMAYHLLGVEVRGPAATDGAGPGWAWFRLKLPVVPGEEPSPLLRVCAAADFPNGISFIVDPRKTSFVNPDLTLYVLRAPVDDWVLVDARTWLDPRGSGMAEGAIYDRMGRIGRSVQSLLVESRSAS